MTRFVDVPAMAKLIQAIEVDEFIAELTGLSLQEIERLYRDNSL